MCFRLFNTICNVKDRQSKKHKVTFLLPILVTQIWMHVDNYNDVYHEIIMIALDSKAPPYFVSIQIDWTEEIAHVDIQLFHRILLKKGMMMINSLNKSHFKIIGNSCS